MRKGSPDGRRALITGGSSGICAAIAEWLAHPVANSTSMGAKILARLEALRARPPLRTDVRTVGM